MSKKKTIADQLRETVSPTDDEHVRVIRKLESDKIGLEAKYKMEKAKRIQAEADLDLAENRAAVLSATEGQINGKALRKSSAKPSGVATAVLCVNDWHAEETVDSEVVNGLNSFDLDVCETRVKSTWDSFLHQLSFLRKSSNIKDAVLWLGGDFITGHIHEELMEGNMCSPTEAVLWIQDHISEGIDHLLKHGDLKSLRVVANYGNHGRTTKKSRISTGYANSFEWMAYKQLEKWYSSDPRTSWNVGKAYHVIEEIQGRRVRFHHGDGMRFWGGVGGLSIPVNKSVAAWNKSATLRADLDIFGHFHQFVDHWNWVCCGCLIGMSAYAIRIKADYQPPTQTIIVIDKEHGKTLAMPIFCGD
jgi:hypothetical protein